jgi:hypothetical protein
MITAELATRVAEAYDAWSGMRVWCDLNEGQRIRILSIVDKLVKEERAHHKASLQALAACVEDALKECE